jgi:hypothetical protein
MHVGLVFLVGAAIFLTGCLIGYFASRARKIAARSLTWPKVAGTITRSEIRAEKSEGGENTGSSTSYRPDIAYSYEVSGKSYTGQRVRAGSVYVRTPKAAEAIREPYPVGRSVEVAYDPARPESSMLEPGNTAGTGTMRFLSIFFVVFGIVVAVIGLYLV